MTALVVEILLGISGFNMGRGTVLTMVEADIYIQKSDMGGGSVLGEMDWIATVKLFKESSERVRPMGPE